MKLTYPYSKETLEQLRKAHSENENVAEIYLNSNTVDHLMLPHAPNVLRLTKNNAYADFDTNTGKALSQGGTLTDIIITLNTVTKVEVGEVYYHVHISPEDVDSSLITGWPTQEKDLRFLNMLKETNNLFYTSNDAAIYLNYLKLKSIQTTSTEEL